MAIIVNIFVTVYHCLLVVLRSKTSWCDYCGRFGLKRCFVKFDGIWHEEKKIVENLQRSKLAKSLCNFNVILKTEKFTCHFAYHHLSRKLQTFACQNWQITTLIVSK